MINNRCAAYAQGRPYRAIVIDHIRLADALLPQVRASCDSARRLRCTYLGCIPPKMNDRALARARRWHCGRSDTHAVSRLNSSLLPPIANMLLTWTYVGAADDMYNHKLTTRRYRLL